MDGNVAGTPEGSVRPEGSQRRLTRRRALTGAAALSASAALVPEWRRMAVSEAQVDGDADLANFALTFEVLEATYLDKGLEAGLLSGRDLEIVTEIRAHVTATEEQITQLLTRLGTAPVERPPFNFPGEFTASRDAFLRQAASFAELGVTAYHGQITNVERPEVLALAAAIAGTKSRHAAVLSALSMGDPLPAPLEATRTVEEVLEVAEPFRGEGER